MMSDMSRELLVQKAAGIGLVAFAISFFTVNEIALAFSVLGQGHFLAAYYYQWKAGKMRLTWVLAYCALAAILIVAVIITRRAEWFALGAGILFFIHHFQDEATLFGKERSFFRLLEQLPPVILYSVLMADALFGTSIAFPTLVIIAALSLIYAYALLTKKYSSDALSAYLFLITAGLAAIAWFGVRVAPEVLFGSVILFHYVCWYIHFYFRLASNKERQLGYVRDMLAIHGIVFSCFALFTYTYWGSVLFSLVFLPIFFYIWAILHIVFSVRMSDYRDSLRW